MSLALVDDDDGGAGLSADERVSRREAEFLAIAMRAQRHAAGQLRSTPGLCSNCAAGCEAAAVYCDAECRRDHELRLAAQRTTHGR